METTIKATSTVKAQITLTLDKISAVKLSEYTEKIFDLSGTPWSKISFTAHDLISKAVENNPSRSNEYFTLLKFINDSMVSLQSFRDMAYEIENELNKAIDEDDTRN